MESWVRKTGSVPFGLSRIVGLTLSVVLVTVLFWAAAAQAQTPADDQYKERVTATEVSSDPADPAGEAKAGGKSPLTARPKAGILPATGGPMFLILVGALVTSGVGLMLLRRSDRGR